MPLPPVPYVSSPSPELEFEHVVQPFGRVIFLGVEVEMQHGMGVPFRFEPFDGEALEEITLAEEVGFHRREQQTLAEAAGTAHGSKGFEVLTSL